MSYVEVGLFEVLEEGGGIISTAITELFVGPFESSEEAEEFQEEFAEIISVSNKFSRAVMREVQNLPDETIALYDPEMVIQVAEDNSIISSDDVMNFVGPHDEDDDSILLNGMGFLLR